jgi:hypothetical protein
MLKKVGFAIATVISVSVTLPALAQSSNEGSDAFYLKVLNHYLNPNNRISLQLNDSQKVFDGRLVCFAYQQGVSKQEFTRDVMENSRIYRDFSSDEANNYFATVLVVAEEVYCPEFKGN